MYARLKEELREAEFEMEVSYCEPEQGPLLGEYDEVEKERLNESLMDSVKSTYQLMEEMDVRPNETKRSYVFQIDDLFVIADDRQSFETVLKFNEVKYDEDSLSNEERSEVLQQKEIIDEFLDGGTQSIEDDLKMKEGKNQNCILMKERVKESPWTVTNSEEEEYVISKSMTIEHDFFVIEDERIPY